MRDHDAALAAGGDLKEDDVDVSLLEDGKAVRLRQEQVAKDLIPVCDITLSGKLYINICIDRFSVYLVQQ